MMRFYWWQGVVPGNYGDMITPALLDYFQIPYERSESDYQAICTGSIIKEARSGTVVLGSGIMGLKDYICPDADYRFVRGPLTRNKILESGGACPEVYGDPGMLLPLMVDESKKIYDIGIVPHHTQYEAVKQRWPKHRVIDLRTDDVISKTKEITECRAIISSSLHGMICAHAFGIPVARVEFSSVSIKGHGIKFLDHCAAVGADPVISEIKDPQFSPGSIDIAPLIKIFQELKYQIQYC